MILSSIGIWLLASGAESLKITKSSVIHNKLFSRKTYSWKEINDEFTILIRSSQPEIKGRRGFESWQVELHLQKQNIPKKIKISIPKIKNENDVVLFLRRVRKITTAEPEGQREISTSFITGKNQRISFKIPRKKVKDLLRDQKKGKRN